VIKTLLCAVLLVPACSFAFALKHATGTVHTAQVDLGYETYSKQTRGLPLIVVHGGPGLDHQYLMRNPKVSLPIAKDRLVVF